MATLDQAINLGSAPVRCNEGARRRAAVIFSRVRQSWVRDYKELAQAVPEHYGEAGSVGWIQQLLLYLQNYQSTIQMEDVARWMAKYPWITQETVGIPPAAGVAVPAFQPPAAPPPRSNNPPAAAARVLLGPAIGNIMGNPPQNSNLPLSARGSRDEAGTSSQTEEGGGGNISKKEKLKRYDAIRDQIVELREKMETLPEFRAVMPAFNLLTRSLSRNYRHVLDGKRREEVLHEDLTRSGIPHIAKGVKRERFERSRNIEPDSDVEVVSVLGD